MQIFADILVVKNRTENSSANYEKIADGVKSFWSVAVPEQADKRHKYYA
jgi:hypothetical protein